MQRERIIRRISTLSEIICNLVCLEAVAKAKLESELGKVNYADFFA